MELTPLQEVIVNTVIPISILIIMFSMGLSIRLSDFKRVFTAPKSFLVAMIGQYVFVPLLAILMVSVFRISPAIAVGAIIVAAIPGGTVSNAFVYVGRGNAALSVSLTAVSQLIGMVTIPVYTLWALSTYYANSAEVDFPILKSVLIVFFVNIVPMGVGMLVLGLFPRLAEKIEPTLRRLSIALLFAIILVVIWPNIGPVLENAATAGLLAVILCVSGVLFGNVVSRAVGLDRRDAFTNGIEIGIQNLSTAALIIATILRQPDMMIYVAAYSVVSPLVMSISALYFNRGSNATVVDA